MNRNILKDNNILQKFDNGVELIQFKNLVKYEEKIVHCFTTRRGGVSSGECESLNLGFNRNDIKENVIRNFELIADCLNIKISNYVFSNQIHDNRIKIVNKSDRGKGILKHSDIIGYDGLITNEKNIALTTFYADCIPVYMYDSTKNVIAMLHSGWRSTYKEISIVALDKMKEIFDVDFKDVNVVLGPSIGKCCFEIDKDVLDLFIKKFDISDDLYSKNDNNKYFLDLQRIIIDYLIKKGINENKISNSNICTKCNNDYFFSHRGDKGKTGSLCGIIQLK
ncbi:MAG: peptidoglycan editing factor PgeF [Clostridiales bacterium]